MAALRCTIVTEQRFDPDSQNHGDAIKALLGIDESYKRLDIFRAIIGYNLQIEFEPWLRHDIDVIFLTALPDEGRLIWPLLKFHRADTIPLLATNHIYAGRSEPKADSDLNGILFEDMPWNIDPDIQQEPIYQLLKRHYSGQLGRLAAMGADAYGLLPQLPYLSENRRHHYNGLTGRLRLSEEGKIVRQKSLGYLYRWQCGRRTGNRK